MDALFNNTDLEKLQEVYALFVNEKGKITYDKENDEHSKLIIQKHNGINQTIGSKFKDIVKELLNNNNYVQVKKNITGTFLNQNQIFRGYAWFPFCPKEFENDKIAFVIGISCGSTTHIGFVIHIDNIGNTKLIPAYETSEGKAERKWEYITEPEFLEYSKEDFVDRINDYVKNNLDDYKQLLKKYDVDYKDLKIGESDMKPLFNKEDASVLIDWISLVGEDFDTSRDFHKNMDSRLNGKDTDVGKKIYNILNLHEWADNEYFEYENRSKLWVFGSQIHKVEILGYIEKRFYLAQSKKYNAPYIKLEMIKGERNDNPDYPNVEVNIHLCDNRPRQDKQDEYTIQQWSVLSNKQLFNMAEKELYEELRNVFYNQVLKKYKEEFKHIYTEYNLETPDTLGTLNQILYGPPGTGKTHNLVTKVNDILEDWVINEDFKKIDNIEELGDVCKFTTFHPAYGYEEFIEGMRPVIPEKKESNQDNEEKTISYEIRDGVFKDLCNRAIENKNKPYFMIIDEINRGNIPKIFGELITLIEYNKRYGEKESISVTLPYSQESFSVPNNVYIIGTMNTADKSLTALDTALRRRFRFIEMMPDSTVLRDTLQAEDFEVSSLIKMFDDINSRIKMRSHKIGHAFFIGCKTVKDVQDILEYKVIPLIQEYEYDDWENNKIQNILFGKLEDGEEQYKIDPTQHICFNKIAVNMTKKYLRQVRNSTVKNENNEKIEQSNYLTLEESTNEDKVNNKNLHEIKIGEKSFSGNWAGVVKDIYSHINKEYQDFDNIAKTIRHFIHDNDLEEELSKTNNRVVYRAIKNGKIIGSNWSYNTNSTTTDKMQDLKKVCDDLKITDTVRIYLK